MRRHPLADKRSLSGVRRQIRSDLSRAGVDPSLGFDCLVAVTEACTNALLHGVAGEQTDPPPEISWEIGPEKARFYVQDFSTRPWNSRLAHPSRTITDAEQRDRGFGLDLMRGLMDEVDIDVGAAGTLVRLTKRFGPPDVD